MKKRKTVLGLFVLVIVFIAGGAVWLANKNIPAPQEKKEIVLDSAKYIQ